MPPFGHRVIGKAAFAEANATEAIGAHKFGHRVVGKRAIATPKIEHGARVQDAAAAKQAKSDSISLTDLPRVLTDNPTFLDALFDAELSRPDGARPEALVIFREHEILGGKRKDILDDIDGLLAEKKVEGTQAPVLTQTEPETKEPVVFDPAKSTIDQLVEFLGDDAVKAIEGSGSGGKVIRADLVKAAKKQLASKGA